MRCLKIINGKRNSVKLPSINHIRNKMCAIEMFKCWNGISPPDYKEYFKCLGHCKSGQYVWVIANQVQKILRKSQVQFQEKLRTLRPRKNDDFLLKKIRVANLSLGAVACKISTMIDTALEMASHVIRRKFSFTQLI